MGVHGILNIMVLALSLATVLLTLLTYLVYKIKQLPFSKQAALKVTEGTYFKRYQFKSAEVAAKAEAAKNEQSKLRRLQSAPMFFVVMTVIIFTTLFFQNGIQNWFNGLQTAKQAKQMLSLLEKGLLKEYDFNPNSPNPALAEVITEEQNRGLAANFEFLRQKRIALVNLPRNQKFNFDHSTKALKSWQQFFKNNSLSVKTVAAIPKAEEFDLVVLPQAKSLSQQERAELNALADSGTGIVATGPAGVLDGTGEKSSEPWLTKAWPVQLQANPDAKSFFPSLFAAGRAPYWELPPGLLMNWFPTDNAWQVTTTSDVNAIYESSYQGRWRQKNEAANHFARSVFKTGAHNRMTWLALDPLETPAPVKGTEPKVNGARITEPMNEARLTDAKAGDPVQNFYSSVALSQALKWTSGDVAVSKSLWPGGARASVVVSVDSEDQFQNAKQLLELFKDHHVPATFFTVSNLLPSDPEIAKSEGSSYELASHTDDHKSLDGKSLEYQFQHIQNSRFEIEKLSGRRVVGFRPPEEGFDETTLNAVKQNGLGYIFGDQQFHRFGPIRISEDGMMFYPRSTLDDFNLKSKYGAYAGDELVKALMKDYHRVSATGGVYLLSLHTQIFGKPEYEPALRSFLKQVNKESDWNTNFASLTSWWDARSNVAVSVLAEKISVKNENKTVVENLELVVDGLQQRSLDISVAATAPAKIRVAEDQTTRLVIEKLEPGQELSFKLTPSTLRQPSAAGPPKSK